MNVYKTDRSLTAGFGYLQASYFCIMAVHTGFFSLILSRQGFTASMIGQVSIVTSIVSLVAQPLLGMAGDRWRANRLMYFVAALCAPLSYYGILHAANMATVLVCAAVFVGLALGVQPLVDGWIALLNAGGRRVDFAFARGAGSLSFALASVVIGQAVDRFGIGSVIWLLVLFGCSVSLAALLLPGPSVAAKHKTSASGLAAATKALAKNKEYVILLLCTFLYTFPSSAFMTYFAVFFAEEGGSGSTLGLALFVLAVVEVPVMFCYSALERRFGVEVLLIVAMVGYAVKNICLGVAQGLPAIVASLLLQSVGLAISVPATQSIIAARTNPVYSTTAQALCASLGMGLGRIFASFFCTWLVGFSSLRFMFIVTSLFALAAAALFGLTVWLPRRRLCGNRPL